MSSDRSQASLSIWIILTLATLKRLKDYCPCGMSVWFLFENNVLFVKSRCNVLIVNMKASDRGKKWRLAMRPL